MNRTQVDTAARTLLDAHGLSHWRIEWRNLNYIGAAGRTVHDQDIIELSIPYYALVTEAEQLDTLRHEVAHAIQLDESPVPRHTLNFSNLLHYLGPDGGHGPIWKLLATTLGADPRPSHAPSIPCNAILREGTYPGNATRTFLHGPLTVQTNFLDIPGFFTPTAEQETPDVPV